MRSVGSHERLYAGPLIFLYCSAPTFVVDADGRIRPPTDWVVPAGCDRARSESRVAGSGLSLELGASLEWEETPVTLSVDAGYRQWHLSPFTASVPLRFAFGMSF